MLRIAGKVIKTIQPTLKGSVTEAFERLVNHMLIAQGENSLCRAVNNPLPPYYNPDYLNTDVDTQVNEMLTQMKATRGY